MIDVGMFDTIKEDLNLPVDVEFDYKITAFKGNKFRAIIINEDLSANEYFIKFPESYVIAVKNKNYFVVPKAFLRIGKYPTMVWYYNNPFPIQFVFKKAEVTALDLRDSAEIDRLSKEERTELEGIIVDAEMVKLGFDSRAMGNIYGKTQLTLMQWFYIAGGLLVVILVILQLSGKVDVFGMLSMSGKGK